MTLVLYNARDIVASTAELTGKFIYLLAVDEAPKRNQRQADNIFNQEPPEFRPSSRVLSRPGGKTSDIFGLAEVEPEVKKTQLQAPGGPALNLFNGAVDAPKVESHHRRDPNWSNADNDEVTRSARPYSANSNASHFSFGNTEQETKVAHTTGRRRLAQSDLTSFSFSDGSEAPATARRERRDPNAQSEEVTQRPSSRVLSRPGGKSNFSFA